MFGEKKEQKMGAVKQGGGSTQNRSLRTCDLSVTSPVIIDPEFFSGHTTRDIFQNDSIAGRPVRHVRRIDIPNLLCTSASYASSTLDHASVHPLLSKSPSSAEAPSTATYVSGNSGWGIVPSTDTDTSDTSPPRVLFSKQEQDQWR